MPALMPPIEHRKAILALAQLKDDTYSSLKDVMASTQKPDPKEIAKAIPVKSPEHVFRELIRTILSMHVVRTHYNMEVSEFVEAVLDGVASVDDPAFSSSEMNTASERLDELLKSNGTISLMSKARVLASDHAYTLCGCRIITDARPIFSDDASEDPAEMAIVHTMKIGYHKNGKHKEIFISLDASDLTNVKEAVERAETKAQTLVSFFKEKGIEVSDLE